MTVQNKQSRNQKDDIELIKKKKWIPPYGKPKQREGLNFKRLRFMVAENSFTTFFRQKIKNVVIIV